MRWIAQFILIAAFAATPGQAIAVPKCDLRDHLELEKFATETYRRDKADLDAALKTTQAWTAKNEAKGERYFRLTEKLAAPLIKNPKYGDVYVERTHKGQRILYGVIGSKRNGPILIEEIGPGKKLLLTREQFKAWVKGKEPRGPRADQLAMKLETEMDKELQELQIRLPPPNNAESPSPEQRLFADHVIKYLEHTGVRAISPKKSFLIELLPLSHDELRTEGWQNHAPLTQIATRLDRFNYAMAFDIRLAHPQADNRGYHRSDWRVVVTDWKDLFSSRPSETAIHELHHYGRSEYATWDNPQTPIPGTIWVHRPNGVERSLGNYAKKHVVEEVDAFWYDALYSLNRARDELLQSSPNTSVIEAHLEDFRMSNDYISALIETDLPLLESAVGELRSNKVPDKLSRGFILKLDTGEELSLAKSALPNGHVLSKAELIKTFEANLHRLKTRLRNYPLLINQMRWIEFANGRASPIVRKNLKALGVPPSGFLEVVARTAEGQAKTYQAPIALTDRKVIDALHEIERRESEARQSKSNDFKKSLRAKNKAEIDALYTDLFARLVLTNELAKQAQDSEVKTYFDAREQRVTCILQKTGSEFKLDAWDLQDALQSNGSFDPAITQKIIRKRIGDWRDRIRRLELIVREMKAELEKP